MTDYTLIKGVDKLYYAIVTQDDASVYIAGTPAALAPLKLAAQTPASNSKTEYFDNQPFLTMSAEGETKIKIDITALPLDVEAALLGKVYDVTNKAIYDNNGTPPDVALGFRAKKSDGTFMLFWFLKGTFMPFPEEAATETDTPDPKGLSLEFTAVRTVHQFDLDGGTTTDSVKRVKTDDQTKVATWFDAVATPSPSAPSALTVTPSPADGASSVAINVSPTLTFNNALRTGTTGVVLTKADGAIVASAITIDAAAKIITINPTSDLANSTTYLITIAGATDIYGQTLANTVINFETVAP